MIDCTTVESTGYELATGPIPIMTEFRHHYGLADIMVTSDQAEQIESVDFVKTRAIVMMVGVKFLEAEAANQRIKNNPAEKRLPWDRATSRTRPKFFNNLD